AVCLCVAGCNAWPPPALMGERGVQRADVLIMGFVLFLRRQAEEMRRDVRELLDEFTASLGATLSLAAGLDIFCYGANRLLGADRTSGWIHDRPPRPAPRLAPPPPCRLPPGARANPHPPAGRHHAPGR